MFIYGFKLNSEYKLYTERPSVFMSFVTTVRFRLGEVKLGQCENFCLRLGYVRLGYVKSGYFDLC